MRGAPNIDRLHNFRSQELQRHCTEGQALLNSLVVSRDHVVPWGAPQIEDRTLETLQQDWRMYQGCLGDTRAQLNSALAKLRQMEQKFQRLDSWLKGMETKGQLRSHRRSDRETKEAQLQLIKVSRGSGDWGGGGLGHS